MASNKPLCGLCDQRHISTPAADWCPICEEALCSTCKDHHSLSKSSRNHKTIPVENYQKLPSDILDIKQYCEQHNDRYQMFCQKHDSPLCPKCISEHSGCTDVIHLDVILQEGKTKETIENIRQSLSDLLNNLEAVTKDRETNITDICYQKQRCLDEIRTLRCKINEHIDNLEKQIVKELQNVADQEIKQINETLDLVRQTKVVDIQEAIDNLTAYASDYQMFFALREIDSQIKQHETSLQSLFNGNKINRVELNCTIDSKLRDILEDVKNYGTVQKKICKSSVTIKSSKDKQAQQLISVECVPLSVIKVNLKQMIHIPHCNALRGCSVTEVGEFLFTDYHGNNGLFVFLSDGEYQNFICTKERVFDITSIREKSVAVSSGLSENTCIHIIDLNSGKKENSIRLPGQVYGVAHSNNLLYCCVEDKNIHVISLPDNTVTTIDNTVLPMFSYVTIHGYKILYTNPDEGTIFCRQRNGTLIWKFKNKMILDTPRGISVDRIGNVYIAGEKSSNVVVLSQDGKNHRQILSEEDGLYRPSALHINQSDNTLLVVNHNSKAYVYNISTT